jgi:hypothetical protein
MLATGGMDGIIRSHRQYERMNIAGLTGITPAKHAALVALGAVSGRC